MYVRITRGRFQPERIDDVEALSSDIAEAIKVLPGFSAIREGVDRNTSTIVAISNWEDRGSAEFPRDKLGDVLGSHHRTCSAGARRDLRNNDHGLIVRAHLNPSDIPDAVRNWPFGCRMPRASRHSLTGLKDRGAILANVMFGLATVRGSAKSAVYPADQAKIGILRALADGSDG